MVLVGLLSENENPEKDLQNCMNKLSNFPIPTEEELLNAKENIKSNFSEDIEHPSIFNEILGKNQFKNIEQLQNNNKIVDSITIEDIKNCTQKYFDTNKASIIVIHPKNTTNEKIKNNYNTIHSNISFGSNNRIYNSKNIETFKFNNNIEVGFYDKPNAINTNINIYIKPQKQINAPISCREVTNTILENLNTNNFGLRDKKQDAFININNGITITTESISDKTQNQCDFILSLMNIDTDIDNELVNDKKNITKQYILNNPENSIDISINKAGNCPDNKTILNNIENLNSDNIKKYWNDIIENSSITIAVTGPKNKIKNTVLNNFSKLGTVLNDNKKLTNTFTEDKNSTVITNITNTNQADICQYYKYKISGNLKDKITFQTLSNILDKRLIENLREKDKLGYSTNSNIFDLGNTEIISASIQTDTDYNKTNITKSINEINQQIHSLAKGNIKDEEVETAKKQLKQNILESSYKQKDINTTLLNGMLSPYGVDYVNKQLDTIELINKKDIIIAASYVFNKKAQYIISAPKDALDYNKESLNQLSKID